MIRDGDNTTSYTIELTTMQWQIVDGTMDNVVAVAIQNGDPQGVVDLGRQVRTAGREQVARLESSDPALGGWPPDGQIVSVTLHGGHWSLITSSLAHHAQIYDELEDSEEASIARTVLDTILRQLS